MKRKFLTDLGIADTEAIKAILDQHHAEVDDFKDDLTELQKELVKVNGELTKAGKSKPTDDSNDGGKDDGNDWKKKYDDEVKAHKLTKDGYVLEKDTDTKRSALKSALKSSGANEKFIELLEGKFDVSKIELDGDKIKDWDKTLEPVKTQFSDIFGTVVTKGSGVANPLVLGKGNVSATEPATMGDALREHYNTNKE